MKKILILILLISNVTFSQDIIVKKNQEEVKLELLKLPIQILNLRNLNSKTALQEIFLLQKFS